MQTVIILIHLMIVLAMVGLVLIQKSEGGGLGMGGGGGGFLSSRGTANVLTRTTAILAALFFATSLFLSILAELRPQAALDPGQRRHARPRPARRPCREPAAACSTSCGGGTPPPAHRRRRPHRPDRRCRDSKASARAGFPALRF